MCNHTSTGRAPTRERTNGNRLTAPGPCKNFAGTVFLEQDPTLQCPNRYGQTLTPQNPMPPATTEFDIRANAFGLIGQNAPRPITYLAPPLAALLATACLAFIACPVPPSHPLSWAGLFWTATGYVLSLFMAAPTVMFALYTMLRRRMELNIRNVALRSSAAAIWLAPLMIFLSEMSMWAMIAAGLLVASMTRLMRHYHEAIPRVSEPQALDTVPPNEIFHLVASPAATRLPFAALCASAAAQAGGLAGFTGHTTVGAALVGITTAIVGWYSSAAHGWKLQESCSAKSIFRATLMVALATAFTTGGLTRYLTAQPGFGRGGAQHSQNKLIKTANSILGALFRAPAPGRSPNILQPMSTPREDYAAIVLGAVHPGVILWPEALARSIVVPPLPAMKHGLFATRHANPFSVPFFGVYWLFKAPDKRPPGGSLRTRGNPAAHTFFTTDHMPLLMEANQNFGTMIDLNCCSKIEVAIRNADRYPGSVSLEVILTNTTLPTRPTLSLGSAEVKSIPRWRPNDDDLPILETLTFALPARAALRNFDEAKVRFHLDAIRAETAAKIAIERFVFVPR